MYAILFSNTLSKVRFFCYLKSIICAYWILNNHKLLVMQKMTLIDREFFCLLKFNNFFKSGTDVIHIVFILGDEYTYLFSFELDSFHINLKKNIYLLTEIYSNVF